MTIPADNPIRTREQDRLGRAPLAGTLATEIRSLDASEGCVVGILGPWGSGKTSLVHLVREELSEDPPLPVLEFNPWLFSGSDQLLESFFLDVGAQFRDRGARLADLATDIEAYAEVVAPLKWLPIVGVWVERARSVTKAVKKAAERRRGGVLAQRERLARKLQALERPIVIVIDDIDRLRTEEIREIFKLVRLTASFPNIIYLLAFDRYRVETALSEEGLIGRDYLEKILQVAHDIPVIPDDVMMRVLTESLEEGMHDLGDAGPFSTAAWPDVLFEIIRPLIRNMRDVRRYVAAVHGTVRSLEHRVELVDAFALEAVRVFLPDVFRAMINTQEALTTPSSVGMYPRQDPPHLKNSIDALIAAAGDRADIARALITRLFHAGRRHIENNHFGPEWQREWLRERRVAHPDILRFYLERVVGEKLEAFVAAEQLFDQLTDSDALESMLRELEGQQLADAIASLEAYEGEYPVEAVEGAAAVLLNQIHRIPDQPGLFGFRSDLIVDRVVLRMLRQFDDPDRVADTVAATLPRVHQLSDKYDLITLVGHQEGAGHKLVSESVAASFEKDLRTEVRTASAEDLAKERDLLRLLYWTNKTAIEINEDTVVVPPVPEVEAMLLRNSVAEVLSQGLGTRASSRSTRLHWDAMVNVSGSEDRVKEMVERTSDLAVHDPELAEARELALKYLEGWRPSEFGD